jgi:DNA-binding NarL/FixJ family response regulator
VPGLGGGPAAVKPVVRPLQPLTPREQEVLRLVIDGVDRGEIARCLRMAPGTVSAHLDGLRQKLPGDRPLYQRAALWAAGYSEAYLRIAAKDVPP